MTRRRYPLPIAALACVVSYLFSGHTGIYHAQRVGRGKHRRWPKGIRLGELKSYRNGLKDAAAKPDGPDGPPTPQP